jgi:hypothetical protein
MDRLGTKEHYRFNMTRLPPELYHCTTEALLTAIDDQFGGVAQWAKWAGISSTAIMKAKRALTG